MNEDEDFDPPPAPEAGGEADHALLAACAAEPETDIGNGRRLRRRCGDLAREHEGAASPIAIRVAHIGWHVYDGRRYREDEDESLIRRLAHEAAEAIRREALLIAPNEAERAAIEAGTVAAETLAGLPKPRRGVPDRRAAERRDLVALVDAGRDAAERIAARRASRLRHAKSSAGSSKLTNMVGEMGPYVSCTVQDLNVDRLMVNCLSGTIDLVQRDDPECPDPSAQRLFWCAEIRPHRQEDRITKLANARWDPEGRARCPQFMKFLQRVQPDPEVRAFLQRFFGYCLTGLTIEQVMLFFHGAGRNGKSTFMDLICHVLGDYAVTLSIDSFAGDSKRGGGEATPDLARLPGARLVAASEPEAGVKLKDALIKLLTGGESLPVRRLHKDFFEVEPHFKIVMSGNHKPRIDDDSDGIWRRVLLVPWDIQIPRGEIDRGLPQKLRAEADGVFAWLVDGALDYLNHGLDVPPAVTAASQEYREESDPIGTFIRMACEVTGDAADEERPLDLFIAYEKFADMEGVFKFGRATFEKRLAKAAGRHWEKPDGAMGQFVKGKNVTTVYRGIRIKSEWRGGGGQT